MKISHDDKFRDKILSKFKKRLLTPREGIHSTDFIFCPAKYFFRKLGVRPQLSKKASEIFTLGTSHHEIIQLLHNGWKREYQVKKDGVYFTIDLYKDYPIEIKSTRKYMNENSPSSRISRHYLDQLGQYCYATNTDRGKLIIWSITTGTLLTYDVFYSQNDLARIEQNIQDKKKYFEQDIKSIKEITRFNLKIPTYDWECYHCVYSYVCPFKKVKK